MPQKRLAILIRSQRVPLMRTNKNQLIAKETQLLKLRLFGYYDLGWHSLLIAQPEHPSPQAQDALPFFLSLMALMMIAAKMTAIINVMIKVGKFIKVLLNYCQRSTRRRSGGFRHICFYGTEGTEVRQAARLRLQSRL